MRRYQLKKILAVFVTLALVVSPYLTSFSYIVAHAAEGASSPWVTVSNGGKEVNEVVEKNGKEYARLGSGEGNDNVKNPAVFREEGAAAQKSGTMEYTFIPETKGDETRFGFYPHYEDSDNFVFVGFDLQGWFWEYKYEAQGEWLDQRPTAELPELGQEYTLKVEYTETTLKASLNDKDLFGIVELDEAASNLVDAPEALKLGRFGEEDAQVLIELGESSEGPTEPEEPGDGEEPEEPEDPNTGDNGWEEGPITIENDHFEEGDFRIIQGDGGLTYNEDGSVTFNADAGSNKIVYNNIPEIFEGSFEVDVTSDKDLTRFGLIYRVLDSGNYNYVGIGDNPKSYFLEIFGPRNAWTSMTQGPEFKAGEKFRMKVEFAEDNATLYIDGDKIDTWTLEGGVSDPGMLGFDKSRGAANITLANFKLEGIVPPPPPEEDTLSSEYMDVLIGTYFPRVIEYHVGDKVLDGQETPVEQLKINGELYTPKVRYDKVSDSEAIYKLF